MTLAEMLTDAGFDWDTGTITVFMPNDKSDFGKPVTTTGVPLNHAGVIREQFTPGGDYDSPAFAAEDQQYRYYPTVGDDGACGVDKVNLTWANERQRGTLHDRV